MTVLLTGQALTTESLGFVEAAVFYSFSKNSKSETETETKVNSSNYNLIPSSFLFKLPSLFLNATI